MSLDPPAVAPDSLPQPSPPSKPILASTLLSNLLRQHEGHQRFRESYGFAVNNATGIRSGDADRLRSGFGELDDYILLGGMERGAVLGVSGGEDGDGAGGEVGRLVSLHLLTTALLSNPLAKASIIDTTGSFPVSLLARIIRLRTASQFGQVDGGSEKRYTEQAINERIEELLGRVAISRVFDIEGIWEVLSEISTNCHSPKSVLDVSNLTERADGHDSTTGRMTVAAEPAKTKIPELELHAEQEGELEIGDSEAEEEDIDIDDSLEEADMSHVGVTDLYKAPKITPALITSSLSRENPASGSRSSENKRRTDIIIIDNMTSPINDLFSNRERTSAHTLLSTFSRTLQTLSQTHNILTILLNTLKTTFMSHQNQGQRPLQPPTPIKLISVFAATASRPALGHLFSDLCTLHLLITSVPKSAKDVQGLYASPPKPDGEDPNTPARDLLQPQRQQQGTRTIEHVTVIEVLKDTACNLTQWLNLTSHNQTHNSTSLPCSQPHTQRRKWESYKNKRNRTQRWAPFIVSADGLTLQNAFGPSTAEKQISAPGQTRIVKQFPFGRE